MKKRPTAVELKFILKASDNTIWGKDYVRIITRRIGIGDKNTFECALENSSRRVQ
jgi:hypothetical protein